jgi:hypothetical protein
MTAGFIAAVLEGFEGTLDVVLERLDEGDLKRDMEDLRERIGNKRQQLEALETSQQSLAIR